MSTTRSVPEEPSPAVTARRDSATLATDPRPRLTAPAATVTTPSLRTRLLCLSLGLVTLAGTVPTIVDHGLLRGPAAMNGSARGTALVMAVLAVPVLTIGRRAVRRGAPWGWPLDLGAVAYLLYNAVMLVFGTPLNHAFLDYVAILSLSMWTVISMLDDLDVEAFAAYLRPTLPVRPIAVYTWVIAGLNALIWLKGAVPASLDDGAQLLNGTGLTTMPTYVQDLAFWLPAMGLAAWWLWRRASWGYVVISAGLVMWVLEGIGVAVDQYWGHLADPTSTVVAPAMIPVFVVLAVVGLVPVTVILRRLPRS